MATKHMEVTENHTITIEEETGIIEVTIIGVTLITTIEEDIIEDITMDTEETTGTAIIEEDTPNHIIMIPKQMK
jgi:hypothetical protein